MTKVIVSILVLVGSIAQADQVVRIYGKVAQDMYESLHLPVHVVHDQHGGADTSHVKRGENFGCEKDLEFNRYECWINSDKMDFRVYSPSDRKKI